MSAPVLDVRTTALALLCGLGCSAAFAQGPASVLKELQLRKGQEYSSARAGLLKSGWIVDPDHVRDAGQEGRKPYGFDGVVCGSGRMAVCSARFLRGKREVMLTLQPKEKLVLDGAWDETR